MRHQTGKTAWQDEILAWPEGDRDWAESCAEAMLEMGASGGTVVGSLSESLATVQSSGERPEELFGTAGAYGRSCAGRLAPVATRLERDLTFRSLPELWANALMSVGFLVAALGVLFGVTEGWNAAVFQGKVILLFPIMGALLAAGCWGWTARTRGTCSWPVCYGSARPLSLQRCQWS